MESNNFLPPTKAVINGLEPEPKISDFELLKTLGKGGYGKVNLYRHKLTGAEYAIKLIDKTKFENKLQKQLFAREVDMMYKIHHPNIVRLYTHFEDESNCYIVLEYIKKGNLYSYTQSRPNKILGAIETAGFIVDLISTLYYLHNMKPQIIHRDIKPENLLIGENGHLKLTDFGGSNYLQEGSFRFTTAGTQIYHSPEMIKKVGYDTSVDIWAIGILIYELMVGKPPFRGDREHSLEDNILHLRIKYPSMNPSARNLIQEILKLEPKNRPNLQKILEHPFITDNVQNPIGRLILPTDVEIKPFIISKQIPGNESTIIEDIKVSKSSLLNSETEEYKILYEQIKKAKEKLDKDFEELSNKKQENDTKNAQIINFLEKSKQELMKSLEDRTKEYFQLKSKLALSEEEVKRLKQENNIMKDNYDRIEKELKDSENNFKLKLKIYKDDIRLYQEKINAIFQGSYTEKNYKESSLYEYSDDNILSMYKKENENLKQQNSKLIKIIEELKTKISIQEEEIKSKEITGNKDLMNLLKENEIELDKKNRIIDKLYKVMSNISNFMNKIKVNNFNFTFDGNDIYNINFWKKIMSNDAHIRANSNTKSNRNSVNDGISSSKSKSNSQNKSNSHVSINS